MGRGRDGLETQGRREAYRKIGREERGELEGVGVGERVLRLDGLEHVACAVEGLPSSSSLLLSSLELSDTTIYEP